MSTAKAIYDTLQSPNVCDQNLETANVVDVINYIARSINKVAEAITPYSAIGGQNATSEHVTSLTEAVIGATAGVNNIADAINNLADAVREKIND